jgi:hypothetical protein
LERAKLQSKSHSPAKIKVVKYLDAVKTDLAKDKQKKDN